MSNELPPRERELVQILNELGEIAKDAGWSLTKQAVGAINPILKTSLTAEAEAAYEEPLKTIATGYLLDSPSDETIAEFRLQEVLVNANIFDLYRRVGRLEEANTLGKQTLEDALLTSNKTTIQRVGNMLTLLQSAEAYQLMGEGNYQQALNKFKDLTTTVSSLDLEGISAIEAAKSHTNRAAYHLSIVDISTRYLGVPVTELEDDLKSASSSIKSGLESLKEIDDLNEIARWESNLYNNIGLVHMHHSKFDSAIDYFEQSLAASRVGEKNDEQIAAVQIYLAYTHCAKEEYDQARNTLESVDNFLETNSFGIYDSLLLPLIEETKEILDKN